MGKVKVNGERYLGLDDSVTRRGAGGCRPSGVFVAQGMRSDQLFLARRGSQVSWTPLCTDSADDDTTGHRPHASSSWSSVLCIPWIVQPGLKGIELTHHSKVGVAGGAQPIVYQSLRLLGLSPQVTQPVSATGALSQQDVTCELPTRASRRLVTSLVWEIKCGVGDVIDQTSGQGAALSLNRLDAGSSDPTFYRDLRSGAHPSTSDLGLQVSLDSTADGVSQQAYDHIYTREGELYTTPWDARRMTVRSAGVVRPPGRITRSYLAYMQTRGCELIERFDPDVIIRPRERYLARQPIEARDELAHLLAIRAIHTRARCRWVGPIGERVLGEPERALWPNGYIRRHPRAQHFGASDPNVLFWASVQLCTKNPRITVLLNLLGVQLAELVAADRAELDSKAGSARWVLDVKVAQYQDGSDTPITLTTAQTVETELLHHPTDSSGQWTALLQERVRAVESLDGYTYREGQLYEEDYSLLQRLELTLDVPFDPAGATPHPVLVRVGVKYVSGSQVRKIEIAPTPEAEDLELICVGASIWEEPTL
jgi:hypothetical protein